MEIHKPKPFHDWREFLSEILIIVIGVSIALIAEQIVEALHWRHKVEAVEAAMRWELAEDDLPQAYVRVLIEPCLQRDLNHLRDVVRPGLDGATFGAAARAYAPPLRTWDSNSYALLNQSDISAHMAQERLQGWAQPYTLMPKIGDHAEREAQQIDILKRSRYARGILSQADADALSDTIDALRHDDRIILSSSRIITADAESLGIHVSDGNRMKLWRDARESYGTCVPAQPPSIAEITRIGGQLRDQPTVRPGQIHES